MKKPEHLPLPLPLPLPLKLKLKLKLKLSCRAEPGKPPSADSALLAPTLRQRDARTGE